MPAPDLARRAAAVALLAFAATAAAVLLHVTAGFDAWAAEVVRRAASAPADRVARVATALASGPATLVAVGAAALLAVRSGARRLAALLVAAWATDAFTVELLKLAVGRARPSFPYTYAVLPSHAFPSGHSANAVAVWGLLAVVAARRSPAARRAAPAAALALALLAGLSRIYLGVHWPSDVVGGWALGAAILALFAAALPPRGARRGTGPALVVPSAPRT